MRQTYDMPVDWPVCGMDLAEAISSVSIIGNALRLRNFAND